MSVDRLKIWEVLFKRAMRVLDTALKIGVPADDWSFGGGTVLMLKHMHRFSKDIDIFVSDPQYVTAFSPRVNDRAEDESTLYDEQHQYVKLYFPEGEVDFVASPIISSNPFETQQILGRTVKVETPLEIVAKKIRYRSDNLKARDIFDLALVLERHPEYVAELSAMLFTQRLVLAQQLSSRDAVLREDFAAIDTISYSPSYEHCVEMMQRHF
ncbi:MAG: nucleotidyl transferase AbiEii/AbiGii toxin family protein [Rhodocyclaceae bacterium]